MLEFSPLSDNQSRMLTDTRQLFEAWSHAEETRRRYRGGMTWKTSNGARYLIRILDSRGGQKSLGRHSDETKAIYDAFVAGKQTAKDRLTVIAAKLDEQARYNKAARIGRVPATAARILQKLDQERLLGRGLMAVGTNALYAYESEAAVTIAREHTATNDIDLLWDVNQRLQLTGRVSATGLMGVLKSVDPSFEKISPYRATNAEGYFVDLVRPLSRPAGMDDGKHAISGDEMDLQAVEIKGLSWLANVPALSAVAVGVDGYPVRMVAPHPIGFALHKRWLSERADRDPAKRRRDRAQSDVVMKLVTEYLPMWRYDEEGLKSLPRELHEFVTESPARP